MATIRNPWIAYREPNPQASLRLFCFPFAGGGATVFRTWTSSAPRGVEICPVQLPGRETRLGEQAFTQLTALVETLGHVLHPHLNMPFAFYGHSMGAYISFELTRYLRRQGHPSPVHLFISSCPAPQVQRPNSAIHSLSDSAVISELRRLNGTPNEVLQHPELMHMLLPLVRADFAVIETYTYSFEEPLDCPISAFGGLEDQTIKREALELWSHQTQSLFTLRMLPGDHFFLRKAQVPLLQAIWYDLAQFIG